MSSVISFSHRRVSRRIICVMFFTSLLLPNLGILGQTPRGSTTAAAKAPVKGKCSGAWTGTVTYTRTQSMTDNKKVERVSGRGHDDRNWEMKYDYKARVAVKEDDSGSGNSDASATISHSFTSNEQIDAVEKNSCDRGKTWRDMRGSSTSKTETKGDAQGVEANVSVGVNTDGTYSVSVGLPQIKGKTSGEQSSTYSGQCTPKEGKTTTMPPTETTIDGNSLSSDGKDRVDPSDPNRLSGSYTRTWQNVTETITWNLQKCGAPLRFTDLAFQDMKFPAWNDWQDISEQKGTIDGNLVKIKAKVLNASGETKYANIKFKETYKGDKWDGARPDAPLKDHETSIRLEAGEEKEVEMIWDSSGYAWYDDGRPRLVQRIKAELEENNKKTDEITKNLKVAPKPLILVHGLWSNWKAWESWQNILTTSHSYDWKAFPVGEKAENGEMNTGGSFMSTSPTKSIEQNARALQAYVRYARQDRNAWHVDIVAHSMGGLISRYFIHNIMDNDGVGRPEDGRPTASHLIMLGTPNMGAPCADVMNTAFEVLGKDVEAMRQLTTESVKKFNGLVFNKKGVKFSALAGNPLPNTCKQLGWNDGVVMVPSAKWTIKDTAESKSLHTDLTGTSDFSNFVKPRVAIGPKGDHNPAPHETPSGFGSTAAGSPPSNSTEMSLGQHHVSRMSGPNSLTDMLAAPYTAQPFAKSIRVAAKQVVEIDIPVAATANFGVTFMTDPLVSATLVDDKGTVLAKNLAGSSEARNWFRSLFVDKPVTAGVWKLRVQNTGDREHEIVLTTWADAVR